MKKRKQEITIWEINDPVEIILKIISLIIIISIFSFIGIFFVLL